MITPGAVRLFLALVVVVHHSTPVRFGNWAVYVFLILSGYWIARMWEEKYQHTRRPVLTFLISRWWRLAPVLFSCLGLTVVCSWIWAWPLPELNVLWFARQFVIVGSTFQGRIIPPQWSLDVEMQFYVAAAMLFPLLLKCYERANSRAAALGLIALLLLVALAYLGTDHHADAPILWPWLGFFLAGAWMWKSGWSPSWHFALSGLTLFTVVSLMLVVWPQTRGIVLISGKIAQFEHVAHWRALWQAVGAILTVPFLALNVQVRSGSADRLLGNWAFPLYLFHWIPRNLYYQYVDWARPLKYNLALLVANFAVAFAGSFLIVCLIDRPFDRLRGRWVKRRLLTADRSKVGTSATDASPVC